jgi:hypothetical protein
MARPPKQGLTYFSHDVVASNDLKLQALISLCGLAGLGFYWFMLERIYMESNFMLDISDAEIIQILSRNMSITTQEFDRYLSVCLKYALFDKDVHDKQKLLSSNGIKKRAIVISKKRLTSKNAYEKNKAKNQVV